jgi:programmed cell death protein 5
VNGIALVKPEKARQVEGMLIQMASTGQLGGKVGSFV